MNGPVTAQPVNSDSPLLLESLSHDLLVLGLIIASYVFLYFSSGRVVRWGLSKAGEEEPEEESDTGTVIGKAENILILTLILVEAYTALGVIFAAKSIVRAEDTNSEDTSYYLTGTIVNFTYSVLVGILLYVLLWWIRTNDIHF